MSFYRCVGPAALAVLAILCFGEALRADKPEPARVAHIRLAGALDESPPAEEPFFSLGGENFRAKLERIKKARTDRTIKALYLQIENLDAGWGKIDELRRAVTDFRRSGKKVYAYLEMGLTSQFLLALACDEVIMPESGWLMLTGVRAEVSFYKDLLDKIGVTADMLQMGDYKGAAEPFTRSGMSPQFRRQLTAVLDDRFDKGLVEIIAQSRAKKGLTPDKVRKLIDEGPYTAKAASAVGLIDRIGYADSMPQLFKAELKVEQVKVVKNYEKAKKAEIDLSNPFDLLKLFSPLKPGSSGKTKVAVIYASGAIISGKSSEGMFGTNLCGSTTMTEAIRQAEEDKTVKAIVLRVDSPGGSALASDVIWNELNRCKKPVVVSMSDVAASGGYYISMAARKIFAEPGTLTGSIGVVGGKFVTGGLEKKIGLRTEIISRGANAGLFSSTTPFSESERKVLTALMKNTYEQFLDKALQGRKKAGAAMTREKLESLAGGRIWTGRQAKENGLVDELGTLDDAIACGRKLAGVPEGTDVEILQLPKHRSILETLLESRADSELRLLRHLPDVGVKLGGVDGLLRLQGEAVWLVLPCQLEMR